MPLEDHYCGDATFVRFASVVDPQLDAAIAGWGRWPMLVEACQGDAILARGIFMVVGERSLDWLDERPPVLDGLSGRECLVTDAGLKRLKESLLRFPCL